MRESRNKYAGQRVLIMGLGLNGGGLESARYLLRQGAELTVTDKQNARDLAASIETLDQEPGAQAVRYVLGRHEMADFEQADLVIKNPGVPPDSPYLQAARQIETDLSLFLAANPARIWAVTGSKGKSSTATALYRALQGAGERGLLAGRAWLGGNIARSPLSFLDAVRSGDEVVLELSSFQLGDLRNKPPALLKPRAALITAIMTDHQDRYGSMDAYLADKRLIYRGQDGADLTIAGADGWGRRFLAESLGRSLTCSSLPLPEGVAGGWIAGGPEGPGLARLPLPEGGLGEPVEIVPPVLLVPGSHQKLNLLNVGLALLDLGLPSDYIRESLGNYSGIEHRLEFFHQAGGIRFYNDSAATIPEAAAAAAAAFEAPPILVTGGTDKDLDFSPLVQAAAHVKALVLLAGTGSVKLQGLLDQAGIPYRGPWDSAEAAARSALEAAKPGDTVILSPGCASFGMFRNEFDRGRTWKETVLRLTGNSPS